ncbi:hypothetical protein Ferp_1099 [Ferroglobus placidus DSM 10642]|uniref:Uncharacterized protein n=1 Tax=Ferroglobus placidus (strain DSM 10642 / AEDII12DO) TaxID=589924 RepID=D3RXP5_FERPA|nr:hypothetical protein [Ferroglobus placidus]ADC65258.1 hypothetical protein Ferp_1099 [Ferroglobus placidus DSM 10642]
MRVALALALILLLSVANAQNLTINIVNYEGGVVSVQIFGENFSINKTFQNSSVTFPVEPGNYHVITIYKNLSIVKNVNVTNDTTLYLTFEETNDVSSLFYLNRHVIVGNGEVVEIDVIYNPTEKFFRGDLEKIIPKDAKNLSILEFTGRLEDFSVEDNKIFYKSVVIQPNSSIRAVYHYFFDSNEMILSSELETKQLVLFLPPDVNAISEDLSFAGTHALGSATYNIYTATNLSKGKTIEVKFERAEVKSEERKSGFNFFFVVGAVLILAGVALYVYSKKKEGKAEEKEEWKV